jgi:hypothetical protein
MEITSNKFADNNPKYGFNLNKQNIINTLRILKRIHVRAQLVLLARCPSLNACVKPKSAERISWYLVLEDVTKNCRILWCSSDRPTLNSILIEQTHASVPVSSISSQVPVFPFYRVSEHDSCHGAFYTTLSCSRHDKGENVLKRNILYANTLYLEGNFCIYQHAKCFQQTYTENWNTLIYPSIEC